MKTRCTFLLIGMLAMVLSGSVLAHGSGSYDAYGYEPWSGSATVWGNSQGHSGYSGTLSYGYGHAYSPGYIPWAGHQHGPRCQHGPGYSYDRAHRQGYKHGRKHGKKHQNKHGRHH